MNLQDFKHTLAQLPSTEVLAFCEMHLLHGTPYVFADKEHEYFKFRKRISHKFDIAYYEVLVIGSAKLGYSPYKHTSFSLDSDVDAVLISPKLFETFLGHILVLQYALRSKSLALSERDYNQYHNFLEYVALGWIRPDKLPFQLHIKELKDDWFEFFRSISNGKSEVGNYKVTGAIFKSFDHLSRYLESGLLNAKQSLNVGQIS